MQIAVFDTYVQRPDGRRMHFDILVHDQPADRDLKVVIAHGQRYLTAKGLSPDHLTTRECRFCHTEFAPPQIEAEIAQTGFAIIEMENCD